MEELLRRIAELVKGEDTGMYRGWSPDQEALRREITEAGLYPEPYTRTAGISDKQNEWLLRRVFELFGMLDDNRRDGFKDVKAQQNAGDDPADITKNVEGKYRTSFQEQISGVGFEGLARNIQKLVLQEARALAAKMREDEKTEEERKRREDEERERREKEEAEKKEREEKERREKEESEKKDREEKDKKIAELSAQVESLMAELQTVKNQALANPIGSRVGQSQPVSADGVAGILSPMNFNPAEAKAAHALSAFMDRGKIILAQYETEKGDRAKATRIRKELIDAQLAYKNGGVARLHEPELQVAAKELGLPFGFGMQEFTATQPAPGNGGVA